MANISPHDEISGTDILVSGPCSHRVYALTTHMHGCEDRRVLIARLFDAIISLRRNQAVYQSVAKQAVDRWAMQGRGPDDSLSFLQGRLNAAVEEFTSNAEFMAQCATAANSLDSRVIANPSTPNEDNHPHDRTSAVDLKDQNPVSWVSIGGTYVSIDLGADLIEEFRRLAWEAWRANQPTSVNELQSSGPADDRVREVERMVSGMVIDQLREVARGQICTEIAYQRLVGEIEMIGNEAGFATGDLTQSLTRRGDALDAAPDFISDAVRWACSQFTPGRRPTPPQPTLTS